MKFEQLIEEFQKHKITVSGHKGRLILVEHNISFQTYGCYIILGKGLSNIDRFSLTVPTKYMTIVDISSAHQIVKSVIEGIKILEELDRFLLSDVKKTIDNLRNSERILCVKSVLCIVKLPDETLSYRLCFDLLDPIINFVFDINTNRVIFTSKSPLTVPWDMETIIYETPCSLDDLESVIFDEYYLIYNAKYYKKSFYSSTGKTKCGRNDICSEVIDLLDISEAEKIYIKTDTYFPLYEFCLIYNKPYEYCSILSPIKGEDQPVRIYTNTIDTEVDYYITGLADRDVLSISKYIQSKIFNSHVKSQLFHLTELPNINSLDVSDKIKSRVERIVVQVDSSNDTYTYKQIRFVQYLYEGLPSGIEFSLEIVMCEKTGEKYYNIISSVVDSMYKIPIECNIRDICNYFILSRYKQSSSDILI